MGAGLGGTATAIRLLQFAREPVEIMLLERRAEYRQAGVAYHPGSNHWQHVFNIQAGRMSAFREDVDDFVSWANREADRSGWPDEWRDVVFTESGPAPRCVYPDYLRDRLDQAAAEAPDGVHLVQVDGEAVDLEPNDGRVTVTVTGRPDVVADHVVLATGLERRHPAFAETVVDHPAFVAQPYSERGIERILGVAPDAEVAIVGSVLSAYDSAALLLRHGHTGKIHMISGSGRTLRTYPADHRHHVLELPPPRLGDQPYVGLDDFIERFQDECRRAGLRVIREHPEVARSVVSERVFKAWEPHLPEILAAIPSADLRTLLDRYGSLLAIMRVGVMAYTAAPVDAAMDDQVAVTAGRIQAITPGADDRLVLSVGGTAPRQLTADLVISNFGRESDYARVDSPLWANLLRRGLACPHGRTGRGVEVDGHGTLVGAAGLPAAPVSVVGSPREGDEIVRNGRTGAFTFNLAAIKNHSVEVAASLLCRLESCYDATGVPLPETRDPELTEALSYSTMIEVRRMTARRRDQRQELTARLEDSLRAIQAISTRHGRSVTERTVRLAVTEVASARLKDLSVTPRDLRGRLGLDKSLETLA
ncbi:FAD/NAD(P)-binding protein [Actinophytocola xinjiangensis]|uniref:FAD/NAD(P)-binding protein n=1 Tax=Actinophytocola xinjiangensis TaxID=485602 RepID=UPI000B271E8C|nr:FAD/NAD(P)-binding protein [Actinophytocola xinjiangensis]